MVFDSPGENCLGFSNPYHPSKKFNGHSCKVLYANTTLTWKESIYKLLVSTYEDCMYFDKEIFDNNEFIATLITDLYIYRNSQKS